MEMEATVRAVETHPWSRPCESTLFPVSTVLRNRRLVTFDSDDEDADGGGLPPSKLDEKAATIDPSSAPSDVVYVTEGRVESVEFDLTSEELSSALRALPRDTWTTLLNDDDRQKLMRYLPKLEGWGGLSQEEAQRMNVETLLSGENIHFGNPVANFARRLDDGPLTVQAAETREAQRQVEFDRFEHRRDVITRTRLLDLKRKSESCQRDPIQAWKKIRLSSEKGSIHCESSNNTSLITQGTSLFLAIRDVLATERLTAKQVAEALQAYHSNLLSSVGGPPLFIGCDRYIESALAFLSDTKASSNGNDHWASAQFVDYDRVDSVYSWHRDHDKRTHDQDTPGLLLLEQAFRAPVSSGFIDATANSSAVKATRRRREQILLSRAFEALGREKPAFDASQAGHPSALLKQALVPRMPSEATFGRGQYAEQEGKRYKRAQDAFVYEDARGNQRWAVGPAFERQSASLDSMSDKLLVSDVPASVNFLSLVYDACACLPHGVGSRKDVRSNLMRSQFIKADAHEGSIDQAIVAALDFLEAHPPRQTSTPCVRFDSDGSCWQCLHTKNEWPAVDTPADSQSTPKPVTPSKMSMKDLLH